MALFRTILILFIIFYVFRIFTRYILPGMFVSYMDDKMHEFTKNQKREADNAHRREGEVTINYKPGSSKDKPAKGEYVDYVEVKE
jgi:hypothetical protein